MTFGSSEATQKTAKVSSVSTPVNHTWYKWDEDVSESDTESGVPELDAKDVAVSATVDAADEASTLTPAPTAANPLLGMLSGTVSYLSYTRRWYTALSCVGAAM